MSIPKSSPSTRVLPSTKRGKGGTRGSRTSVSRDLNWLITSRRTVTTRTSTSLTRTTKTSIEKGKRVTTLTEATTSEPTRAASTMPIGLRSLDWTTTRNRPLTRLESSHRSSSVLIQETEERLKLSRTSTEKGLSTTRHTMTTIKSRLTTSPSGLMKMETTTSRMRESGSRRNTPLTRSLSKRADPWLETK